MPCWKATSKVGITFLLVILGNILQSEFVPNNTILNLNPDLVWMSSVWKNAHGKYAVMSSCNATETFLSSTNRQTNPAWAIELGANYLVTLIQFRAGNQISKASAFKDAYVIVSDDRPDLNNTQFDKHCAYFKGPATKWQKIDFLCGIVGGYVAMALKAELPTILAMCSVKIFADLSASTWTTWTAWSNCSHDCDTGIHNRTRRCLKYPGKNSAECWGNLIEFRLCSTWPCRANGYWGTWSDYSHCSASCGDAGYQTRHRHCHYPRASTLGDECSGEYSQNRSCNRVPCPTWSFWTEWTMCSRSCNLGVTSRSRECLYTTLQTKCYGISTEMKHCSYNQCTDSHNVVRAEDEL